VGSPLGGAGFIFFLYGAANLKRLGNTALKGWETLLQCMWTSSLKNWFMLATGMAANFTQMVFRQPFVIRTW